MTKRIVATINFYHGRWSYRVEVDNVAHRDGWTSDYRQTLGTLISALGEIEAPMTTDPVPAHDDKSAAEIANEYNAQFGIKPPEPISATEQEVPS